MNEEGSTKMRLYDEPVEGSTPKLYYRFEKSKRRVSLPAESEKALAQSLIFLDDPPRSTSPPKTGKKTYHDTSKNTQSREIEYKPTIRLTPGKHNRTNIFALSYDFRPSKKIIEHPHEEPVIRRTGRLRVEPPKEIPPIHQRGKKRVIPEQKEETTIEAALGRKGRRAAPPPKEHDGDNVKFISRMSQAAAASYFSSFREFSTDSYLSEQKKKEAVKIWKEKEKQKHADNEKNNQVAEVKALDKWDKEHEHLIQQSKPKELNEDKSKQRVRKSQQQSRTADSAARKRT